MTEILKKKRLLTLFETFFFSKALFTFQAKKKKKRANGLLNKKYNSTLLTMQGALKIAAGGLHPFCFNGKEKMLFDKTAFFSNLFMLL